MKRASLQLLFTNPAETAALAKLTSSWTEILNLLDPLFQRIERRQAGDYEGIDDPVVPLVTLTKLCGLDASVATEIKDKLFPAEYQNASSGPMEDGKFDDNKFNPNDKLPADAALQWHLIKAMTSTHYTLKRVVADFIYAACEEDPKEVVRLCGLGSSAGLLQEKGMLEAMQQGA